MSETISGYHNMLQRLNTATPTVTITGTINAYGSAGTYMVNGSGGTVGSETIDAAVVGPSNGHFTIHNNGLIETHGTNPSNQLDVGIVLGASGSIYNTETIQGGSGVAILGTTGSAYLYNGNLIAGSIGVGGFFQGDATIVNIGSIAGADTGLQFASGGYVHNYSRGTITGGNGGGIGAKTIATVNNAGHISGYGYGVFLQAGGSVINSGSIAETGTQAGNHYGGIVLYAGGSVTNTASGAISGLVGINIQAGTSAAVDNAGTIKSLYYGIAVYEAANITNSGYIKASLAQTITLSSGRIFSGAGILVEGGSVTNQSGGTIIGHNGILGVTAATTVNNAGYVSGTGAYSAIYLGQGGSVTNSGTIKTQSTLGSGPNAAAGINIHGGGSVNNSGLITGGEGVYFKGTGSLNNTGTIDVISQAFAATGLATVTNSGLLEATATTFVYNSQTYPAAGVGLSAGGLVTNLAGTIAGGAAGIISYGTATSIINNSVIESTGTAAFTIGNSLTGSLSLEPTGINLLKGGTVNNSGQVSGSTGVYLGNNGSSSYLSNTSTGTITGTVKDAINAYKASIYNAGHLSGSYNGIYASHTSSIHNTGLITVTGTGNAFAGIYLEGGGTVTNSGTVSGFQEGIDAELAATIVNSGQISEIATGSNYAGVFLLSGGRLTNTSTATITGDTGIRLSSGYVSNAGHVTATGHVGIYLNSAGTVMNSGSIQAVRAGIELFNGGYVNNSGTITAGYAGVDLSKGGTLVNSNHIKSTAHAGVSDTVSGTAYITNAAGGTISGKAGIYAIGTATINNAGYIYSTGTKGAVDIASGRLIYNPGASFGGKVTFRDGNGVIEFAYRSPNHFENAGQITGNFDTQFTGFNSIVVDSGAYWDLGGTTFGSTVAITNDGTIAEIITQDLEIDGALGGTGVVLVDTATLNLNGSVSSGEQASFNYDSGVLSLRDSTQFAGTITNFHSADTIQLNGFTASSHSFVSGSGLVLSNGTTTETLDITGAFGANSLHVTDDAGGTEITICYLRGTKILTPSGEVNVETLQIGDELITRFGGIRPIKWIGRQSFARRFVKNNRAQFPVRIEAGALGNNLPKRDLSISPGHSMLLNGQLVLAKSLVNGINITQHHAPAEIHYYQIEFETHDCVLAEGAWSESYADSEGMRNKFHNATTFSALYPDYKSPAEPQLCAPRPLEGPELSDLLQPVIARAAAETAAGPLRGWVDAITAEGFITGWAQDEANPELPVLLELVIEDKLIRRFLACDYRGDLAQAGIGQGRCSFAVTAPVTISPETLHQLKIRRVADSAPLLFSHDLQAGLKAAA